MKRAKGNHGRGGGRAARVLLMLLFGLAFTGWLLAHGGEDHGDAAPAKPAEAVGSGGGLMVPKEQQFSLGMLTELVAMRDLSSGAALTGRVIPRTDGVADVVAPVPGRVVGGRLPRLGERVSRGELLFRIEQVLTPTERTGLRTEQIRAGAELAAAEREVSRFERLEGVVAAKQLVEARIRRDAARDSYNAITAQLSGRGTGVAVTAPIAGVITGAEIAEGEVVDGTRSLYTIVDLSKVWVEADLFEGDLARVQGAERAEIRTPSYPGETFAGTLYRTGSTVDPASRTIRVLFLVDNRDQMLKLNMSASVTVASGTVARTLAIPQSAVVGTGARKVVFLHTAPETFEPRDVTLGAATGGGYVEVRRGVAAGDRVVTSGSYQLRAMAGL